MSIIENVYLEALFFLFSKLWFCYGSTDIVKLQEYSYNLIHSSLKITYIPIFQSKFNTACSDCRNIPTFFEDNHCSISERSDHAVGIFLQFISCSMIVFKRGKDIFLHFPKKQSFKKMKDMTKVQEYSHCLCIFYQIRDPLNYRAITIISYLGKIFHSMATEFFLHAAILL